ncbi:tetratricopeptide repeat protein [Streptomyces sp. ISL-98]|uniref:FxSxx-COOH system tetratricopeptide repeat protein n=1 Tax=Streptomyces sp. ISL-98 TaxID=2819192 RepID=UPI001BEA63F2|nr:FxSxx-COOH system tetratricopeptide repeat protein [Streptomyces sp. ISL-98]MBT2505952.1 tetratricopeptide repeat protein [Streptomyces sp. ISL-98]
MPSAPQQYVTVVYAGQSQSWVDWMKFQLAGTDARPGLVRWDPLHRAAEESVLTELLERPGRLLIVIDDWFLRLTDERRRAWEAVLRQVVRVHGERIASVTVTAATLPDEAAPLAPVRLRGLGPAEASRRLLATAGVAAEAGRPVDLARGPRFPDDLQDVHNAPRHNRRFTGREEILEQLHDAFAAGGEGARVALHGPPGVGKTQVAIEYVHRHAGEYDIVWWVSASVRLRARSEFAALADQLGVEHGGRAELTDLIEAAKNALRGRRRWLVVLDGAEDPEALDTLLPEGPGHLLITTPRTTWSQKGAELVGLPSFAREESVAFACLRTRRLTPEHADRLASAVQDLPLLIDQTAAWLDTHPTASVPDYVRHLQYGDPHVADVEPSREYPVGFQAAWGRTVNGLREQHPPVYELLVLLCFFSPDVVPARLLRVARAGDLPDHLAALVGEPSTWNSALRTLSEATSMRVEYEPGPRMDIVTVGTLRMHRLFHRFVRNHLAPGEHARASAIACRVLVAGDPRDPGCGRHWQRYAELVPHLAQAGALESTDRDVRAVVLNCVEYLRVRGEYTEGRRLSRAAVDSWQALSGPTDPDVLVALHQLANMERRLGDYTAAENIGRATLERVSAAPEAGPIELVRAKNGLGGTLMALGAYDEARALFQDAADSATDLLGEFQVPRILSIRSNLAIAIGLLGRYQEAHDLHNEILESSIALFGGKSRLTLHAGLHTAWMLRLLGRYGEALAVQEQNCRLHAQVLDKNHSQTLLAEHNLALCMRRDGNLGYAAALMRSVRDRITRRRGAAHPEALLVSTDYAMLLRNMGDLPAAREIAETTAERYAVLLGDAHPYAAGALDNCALIQRDAGEHEAALIRAEQARKNMQAALGAAHVWSVGCAMNTASARAAAGDVEGAAALGRDALERARRAVGDAHVLTLNLAAGLAQDLRTLGDADAGEAIQRGAVERLTENFFQEHQQVRHMLEGQRPYWDFEPQTI